MEIRSRKDLVNYVNSGHSVKYLYFWGHQKPKEGVSKACFSQWYDANFEIDDVIYQTAEHYMMAEKARLFCDTKAEEKIIRASNPGEAKKLGRSVLGFDNTLWLENRFSIVVNANLAKFAQDPELKTYLLSTGSRVLVEASPVDKIWGVGLAVNDVGIDNPNLWKGDNLLGFALMEVRSKLVGD